MVLKKQIDSPAIDKGSSGQSSGGGRFRKRRWTAEEDAVLREYIKIHGARNWDAVSMHSGLDRCSKSCRLRWTNHLSPNLKKSVFTSAEQLKIMELHAKLGNKWARIALDFPGRTANDIKNSWNTRMKRIQRGYQPRYQPNMQFDVPNDSLQPQVAGGLSNVTNDQNDNFQNINTVLLFDNRKAIMRPLSCTTSFATDTPITSMMTQGLGSKSLAVTKVIGNSFKRPRKSEMDPRFPSGIPAGLLPFPEFSTRPAEKMHKSIHFSSPCNTDQFNRKIQNPYSTSFACHALLNGNTPNSLSGTRKLDIPSVEYAGHRLASAPLHPLQPLGAYINSPATTYIESSGTSNQSDCVLTKSNGPQSDFTFKRNDGLLGSILLQSRVLGKNDPQSSFGNTGSSLLAKNPLISCSPRTLVLEKNGPQSPSPMRSTVLSIFDESRPISFSSQPHILENKNPRPILGFNALSIFDENPLNSCSFFDDLLLSKTTSASDLIFRDNELVSTTLEQEVPDSEFVFRDIEPLSTTVKPYTPGSELLFRENNDPESPSPMRFSASSTFHKSPLISCSSHSHILENKNPQPFSGFTASSLFDESPPNSCSFFDNFDDLILSKTTSGFELVFPDTVPVTTPVDLDVPGSELVFRDIGTVSTTGKQDKPGSKLVFRDIGTVSTTGKQDMPDPELVFRETVPFSPPREQDVLYLGSSIGENQGAKQTTSGGSSSSLAKGVIVE